MAGPRPPPPEPHQRTDRLRLDISPATAKYHVSEILSKLAVTTREQAAAWQPPTPERRWRERAIAPLATALRRLDPLTPAKAAIGAGALAAIAGLAVLAWALLRTSNEGSDAAVQATGTATRTNRSEPPSLGTDLQRGLWTFSVDGGEPTYVLPIEGLTGSRFGDTYELSPDGLSFAVARGSASASEVIVGTTTGGDQHTFTLDFDAYTHAVSPGGAMLLLEGARPEGTRMYLLHVATGELTDVGPPWHSGVQASWSPNGQQLLLVGAPDEHSQNGAYVADASASNLV